MKRALINIHRNYSYKISNATNRLQRIELSITIVSLELGNKGKMRNLIKLCIAMQWLCATTVSDTMRDIPVKGCRGIKESLRGHRIAVLLSGLPKWKQRASASLIPDTWLCAFVLLRSAASSSVRNHCSSLAASPSSTVHVPSVSRLYVACVLRQSKGPARVCRDWKTTFRLLETYPRNWRARNRDISPREFKIVKSY